MRILTLLLCGSALFFHGAVVAKPEPIDGIAAIVNDAVITKSELKQQAQLMQKQLQQNGNATPNLAILEKQVLEHLITNEVQLQMAKRTGIEVDENTLDNTIENIAKDNGMTVTQLREALARDGINFSRYRNNVRQQMIISQLQQRDLYSELQVSEQEVEQFLQSPSGLGGLTLEYRLSHILIPLPESPTPNQIEQAQQKVKEIIAQLRSGKDFAQVALVEAKGEQALNGGDLGWRKIPELPTIFEKIVPALAVGDVPEPIRSPSGFHIIKLADKRNNVQTHATTDKTLVRHILIKTNAATSDREAQHRLSQLRQKILKGEDFEKLAKAHSADLASSSNGGNLGWVRKDVLVKEFSDVMDALAINDVSEPFKTSFGWHIMQVLDRKAETGDKALRQKAKEMIQQRKYEEKAQAWARQLRDEAYIKNFYETT